MPHSPVARAVIVVATGDFEVYHGVVDELRSRDAVFTTVERGEPLPEATSVVVVAPDDPRPDDGGDLAVVVAEPDAPRQAAEAALAAARSGGGRTVIGVDPGTRPGVAVLAGETVVAAYQVPLTRAVELIRERAAEATDPVVRVGDGARLEGARVIDELDDVRVEMVDETGTTPHLGAGARGVGDVLAAVNIARREGEPIESRDVEPTAGELQTIKDRSRERSGGDRTIDEALARRVALGELTVDEALSEHRRRAGRRPDDGPAASTGEDGASSDRGPDDA